MASQLPVQPTKIVIKKSRSFTSTFIGFLSGLVVAGGSGMWQLADDYQRQNAIVLGSINGVERSVDKVSPAHDSDLN